MLHKLHQVRSDIMAANSVLTEEGPTVLSQIDSCWYIIFHHLSYSLHKDINMHTSFAYMILICNYVKKRIKQSHYRPGVAQRVPGS
jgi:ABC-type protease/lipase transport system fused ATPase/permease subunit